MIQWAMKASHKLLVAFGLHPLVVADSASGGATNSQHLIGFGLSSEGVGNSKPGVLAEDYLKLNCKITHLQN
jgi:hypothetical protein